MSDSISVNSDGFPKSGGLDFQFKPNTHLVSLIKTYIVCVRMGVCLLYRRVKESDKQSK
jgi:hypothetical protein